MMRACTDGTSHVRARASAQTRTQHRDDQATMHRCVWTRADCREARATRASARTRALARRRECECVHARESRVRSQRVCVICAQGVLLACDKALAVVYLKFTKLKLASALLSKSNAPRKERRGWSDLCTREKEDKSPKPHNSLALSLFICLRKAATRTRTRTIGSA